MAKIDLSGECWTWTGGHNGQGYGQFHFGTRRSVRRTRYAHRVAYELWVGPIPAGMSLDHLCDRGRLGCLTPSHLIPVSTRDNVLRSATAPPAIHARQTHCGHGHPLSGDNLILVRGGRSRRCRTCRDAANAARDPQALREEARNYYWAKKGTTPPQRVNGKKTHCLHGHPYTDANTRIHVRPDGLHRSCKTCAGLRWKR